MYISPEIGFKNFHIGYGLDSLKVKIMSRSGSDKSHGTPQLYHALESFSSYCTESFYLEMRDGVKIAIDLYLPKILNGKKVPAIIHQVVKIQLDLLLTSYLLKQGHELRLSISGADWEYFKNSQEKHIQWKLHHSDNYPSILELPIVQKP